MITTGVSALNEETADLDTMVNQADEALLKAKRTGRNQIVKK